MSDYCCDKCNWTPPDIGFYYINGDDISDCTELKGWQLIPKPPEGIKAYPIYSNFITNNWAAQEFGGDPKDWDETHCCPNCQEEFVFSNSNY